MRQVMIPKFGGPEVFEVRTGPDPEPGPGEIRIRVGGAGVNFADLSARAGMYPEAPPPPMVVGYEVAGTVDKVGDGTDRFAEGDRVTSVTRFGGYADVVTVPQNQAAKLPDDADLVKAAGIPVAYLTAYVMLNRLGAAREGQSVLIHSAGGGVGLAALQLSKGLGLTTFGTASTKKHDRLREMGLDHPIDYRTQDFEKEVMRITNDRGVDIALDAQAGSSFRKSYRCLAPMGRLFMFGLASANAPTRKDAIKTFPKMLATTPVFHPFSLMNNNRGVFGINMARLWDLGDLITETLDDLVAMWARHEIDPIIDSTYPFEQAGDAQQQLEQGRNFGKVILVP